MPASPGSSASTDPQPLHSTGPFGSEYWQHSHHHGTRSGNGSDPGSRYPTSTPTSGYRTPTGSPTSGSHSPTGGQETSPP